MAVLVFQESVTNHPNTLVFDTEKKIGFFFITDGGNEVYTRVDEVKLSRRGVTCRVFSLTLMYTKLSMLHPQWRLSKDNEVVQEYLDKATEIGWL